MPDVILYVEDSADDARLLELTFRKAGIANRIVVAPSGEEGVGYMRGEGPFANRDSFPLPAVMLVDLKLLGITGFEMLEILARESLLKNVLVVVVSAFIPANQLQRAYSVGARTVLAKPVNSQDVANMVKHHAAPWAIEQRL